MPTASSSRPYLSLEGLYALATISRLRPNRTLSPGALRLLSPYPQRDTSRFRRVLLSLQRSDLITITSADLHLFHYTLTPRGRDTLAEVRDFLNKDRL